MIKMHTYDAERMYEENQAMVDTILESIDLGEDITIQTYVNSLDINLSFIHKNGQVVFSLIVINYVKSDLMEAQELASNLTQLKDFAKNKLNKFFEPTLDDPRNGIFKIGRDPIISKKYGNFRIGNTSMVSATIEDSDHLYVISAHFMNEEFPIFINYCLVPRNLLFNKVNDIIDLFRRSINGEHVAVVDEFLPNYKS